MEALARFILKSRLQAALVVAAMAVLSLLLTPLIWFSSAAVALVTLVNGAREGLKIVAMAAVGAGLLAWLPTGSPLALPLAMLAAWLPVWLLAVGLQYSRSLSLALLLGSGLGMLVAAMAVVLVGGEAEWRVLLEQLLEPMLSANPEMAPQDMQQTLDLAAPLIPGLLGVSLFFSTAVGMLLGRWWQSLVYRPGAFGEEYRVLRLGTPTVILAALMLAAAWLAPGPLTTALAMLAMVLYLFQGVALMHAAVNLRQMSVAWLVGFYVLLVLLNVQMVVLVALMGWLDTWADLRARLAGHSGAGNE